jgi:hypothetical protein
MVRVGLGVWVGRPSHPGVEWKVLWQCCRQQVRPGHDWRPAVGRGGGRI